MRTGTRISAIGHGVLVVLAVFGLPWFGPREREPIRVADVSFVSEERKSGKIFLRADGAIPYEGVMQVMGALNASGFNDIGLVTEQGGPKFDGAADGQDG